MTISIQHRLKPFCHLPGYEYLIPGSTCLYKVYPCRVEIKDLCNPSQILTIELPFHEFYKAFTCEVDYERKSLRVFGRSKDGFIEYRILKRGCDLFFKLERYSSSCTLVINGASREFLIKEEVFLLKESIEARSSHAHLFLGSTKKQELDVINKSKDPAQMLPYIFSLGDHLKDLGPSKSLDVLDQVESLKTLHELEKNQLLERLLKCNFSSGLIPHLQDTLYMGLGNKPGLGCDLDLLKALSLWLKTSLISCDDHNLTLLKGLPRDFVAGKATHLEFKYGLIHLEWTKGFVRRVILDIKKSASLKLQFGHKVKSFRINRKSYSPQDQLDLQVGIYQLDKFEA